MVPANVLEPVTDFPQASKATAPAGTSQEGLICSSPITNSGTPVKKAAKNRLSSL